MDALLGMDALLWMDGVRKGEGGKGGGGKGRGGGLGREGGTGGRKGRREGVREEKEREERRREERRREGRGERWGRECKEVDHESSEQSGTVHMVYDDLPQAVPEIVRRFIQSTISSHTNDQVNCTQTECSCNQNMQYMNQKV